MQERSTERQVGFMRTRKSVRTRLSVTVRTEGGLHAPQIDRNASTRARVAHVCTYRCEETSMAGLGRCNGNQNMQTVEANSTPNKNIYNKIFQPTGGQP